MIEAAILAAIRAPTPLPTILVNVGHLAGVEVVDSSWTKAVAIGTIFLALATAALALFTYLLARKTSDSIEIAQQALANERAAMIAEQARHMDGFMPHISLEVTMTVEKSVTIDAAPGQPPLRTPALDVTVISARNIGPGFAQNVRHSNQNIPDGRIERFPVPIAFAANSEPVILLRRKTGQQTLMGWTLTYEDAFGRTFESRLGDDVTLISRYQWSGPHKPDYLVTERGERIVTEPGKPIVVNIPK